MFKAWSQITNILNHFSISYISYLFTQDIFTLNKRIKQWSNKLMIKTKSTSKWQLWVFFIRHCEIIMFTYSNHFQYQENCQSCTKCKVQKIRLKFMRFIICLFKRIIYIQNEVAKNDENTWKITAGKNIATATRW